MNFMFTHIYRKLLPKAALKSDLLAVLDLPPSAKDFPSLVGHRDDRGYMCVCAEISRRLDHELSFRNIMQASEERNELLWPSKITCTSNSELHTQTWESFCKQEGESSEKDHGCRSHADYCRLDDSLRNGSDRSECRVARWGSEVIWQSGGNHRVAAMAHFERSEPSSAYAVDVSMSDYRPNPNHALAGLNFGLVRERRDAVHSLYSVLRPYAELKAAVKVHVLRELLPSGRDPDPRFADTYLVIFQESTPLAVWMQHVLRESRLIWDLRRYFNLP